MTHKRGYTDRYAGIRRVVLQQITAIRLIKARTISTSGKLKIVLFYPSAYLTEKEPSSLGPNLFFSIVKLGELSFVIV